MTRVLPFILVCSSLFLLSCDGVGSSADARFEALAGHFIERWLVTHPESATELGDHRFDSRLNDYSRAGVEADIALCKAYSDTLAGIKVEELSAQHMIDYDILRHALEAELFALEELREWEWNPLQYNTGDAVYILLARESAPLTERLAALKERLLAIPTVIAEARDNLKRPPAIHTQTAIQQNQGTIALLTETLQAFIDSVDNPLRHDLGVARDSAVTALRAYDAWLSGDLLQRSDGDFRLGAELYAKKFRLRLDSDMSYEDLLARAEQDLERTTEDMYRTALQLYPSLLPGSSPAALPRERVIRAVLDRLADEHPSDSTIVPQAGKDLAEATAFVKAQGIVTVPDDALDIIVMPEFQRGVAVAYCDSPGPLEKNGKTFFAIAPTPEDWTDARVLSFYREYNNHMLKNLVVHEAMPGHFVQLAVANKAEAPTLLRAIMPSGVFAEGWATYTEQVMSDAGFGGPALRMQQLKMRLRLLINAMIDQGVHARGMSERDAMALMMQRGFQEEGEAAGKWRRACLTSAQLSTYYYGNIAINDIRARYERKMGAAFSLKNFHDLLLSHGTISPKYLPILLKLPATGEAPGA